MVTTNESRYTGWVVLAVMLIVIPGLVMLLKSQLPSCDLSSADPQYREHLAKCLGDQP